MSGDGPPHTVLLPAASSAPVFCRWVVSSAKKEDADEDIAKYDGKATPFMTFRATVLES